MTMKTHKSQPIPEPARVGLKELHTTGKLPSDEKQKKATLTIIKWILDQRELYTATFEELNFKQQSNSIKAQIMGLEQAILAKLEKAPLEGHDRDKTLGMRVKQIKNLEKRLSGEGKTVIADNP
jgi:hypothetical protein